MTAYGVFAPHLLSLSIWPDEETATSFDAHADLAAMQADLGVADTIVSYGPLDRQFRSPGAPYQMHFHAGAIYELCALWRGPEWSEDRERAFFEMVMTPRRRHCGGPGVVFVGARGDYRPNLLSLSEWPRLEAFFSFVEDPDQAALGERRRLAFSRMDATATRLLEAAQT